MNEDEILYAVGQGALAIECRADNESVTKLLEPIYDLQAALRVTAERSFLKTLGGGCSAPVAVCSQLKTVKENQYELSLSGAVWSLDGQDEVNNTDTTCLVVNKDLRCATCPYRKNGAVEHVSDIENLECAKRCPLNLNEEPVSKKLKLDIPVEILKNDPHDQCPIQIPVGADFMGKCPYLESQEMLQENNCPANGNIEMLQPGDYSKCPFLKEGVLMLPSTSSVDLEDTSIKDTEQDNLFCGLILHQDATLEGMSEANKLGVRLAHSLISKGALEVMSKAQAVIHGEVSQNVASVS